MKRILLLVLSLFLVTGCSSTKIEKVYITKYEVLTPTKIEAPKAPTLTKYDTRYGLDYPKNFKAFQTNQLLESDYIINLISTIEYYETQIDACNKEKQALESKNKE